MPFSLGVNCPVSTAAMAYSWRCTLAMHLSSTIPPRFLKSKSRCRMPDAVGLEAGRLCQPGIHRGRTHMDTNNGMTLFQLQGGECWQVSTVTG